MRVRLVLLAAGALAGASPASAELDLGRTQVSHLPNGLTVMTLEDHSFPVVSVQMLYKSGSAAETTGKTGLAHFLEHLAFRGSENFPKGRATELIYDWGGEWHGYTAMDQTTYFATMPKTGLELLLRIEADRMARTLIDPASIEAEKGAVITELHSYENDPASVLQDAVVRTAIQAHPYGSPMAGYVSDVERLTIEDAQGYYNGHYAPANAVLAIAGDFDPQEAKALIERTFGSVSARPVAQSNRTSELPQRGERRTRLLGPVDRQHFQFAFPSPAASNRDFPAFLVLQQILSGTPGLNPRQSGWSGTRASEGALAGATGDIATWLAATRDPFLFIISGSIDARADQGALEREIAKRIDGVRDRELSEARLAQARKTVVRTIRDDVLTTEDAAHQLAYFEGIGALEMLLNMPKLIAEVTAADVRRVARTYLAPDKLTAGWIIPGPFSTEMPGAANAKPAANRPGAPSSSRQAGEPQLARLTHGLPAIVQGSPLSSTVTVELLLSGPIEGGADPDGLHGLDAVVRSGHPDELAALVSKVAAHRFAAPAPDARSEDPATRLQQLISEQMGSAYDRVPHPLAVILSGDVDPNQAMGILERELGKTLPARLSRASAPVRAAEGRTIRERIAKPLSQGAIGYVVDGPAPATREALAWRMLLYVLTHDYSGRLGRSAITEKGIVYHIYSSLRTDGQRSWATIWTGVDPDKADAMEAELRSQLDRLVSEPPAAAEVEAARNHLLGRDLTAAQSNDELAAKLAREFVETGRPTSHAELRAMLEAIGPQDLARAARSFARGTLLRVDVGVPPR